MKTEFSWIFAVILALSSSIAFSATNAPSQKPRTVFKKSESYQFSGSKLKGRLKKPELSYIYKRKGLRQEQIVNIPENFNDEILNGAGQF